MSCFLNVQHSPALVSLDFELWIERTYNKSASVQLANANLRVYKHVKTRVNVLYLEAALRSFAICLNAFVEATHLPDAVVVQQHPDPFMTVELNCCSPD